MWLNKLYGAYCVTDYDTVDKDLSEPDPQPDNIQSNSDFTNDNASIVNIDSDDGPDTNMETDPGDPPEPYLEPDHLTLITLYYLLQSLQLLHPILAQLFPDQTKYYTLMLRLYAPAHALCQALLNQWFLLNQEGKGKLEICAKPFPI